MKRTTRLIAATSTLLLAAAGLAPAAMAAVEAPVTVSGTGTVLVSWAGSATAYDEVANGNVLHVCDESASECLITDGGVLNFQFMTEGQTFQVLSAGASLSGGTLAAGRYKIQMVNWVSNVESPVGDLLSICVGGGCGDGSAPPPVFQQVPMPASGTCAAVVDTDFAFGTGLTGGWTPQWGEWAAQGKGDRVCGRTLFWSNSIGFWAIES